MTIEPSRGSSEVLHARHWQLSPPPPPPPVLCEHVGLMSFFFLRLGPEEAAAAAGPLLSRVESSRRRCEGRCSRRER